MSYVLLLAASVVIGGWILRRCRIQSLVEALIFRVLTGLCVCGALILVVGSYSLPLAQLVINAIALFGFGYEVFRSSDAPQDSDDPPWQPLAFIEWICVFATGAALLITLLSALAPVTGWDATVAHIALPKDYVREGRICLIEGNEYSVYPQFIHCLYAYSFVQGGARGVMLMSWTFALLACGAVFVLGRRVESRRCGLIAAAILATAPIFFDQGGTASVDLAFCAFATAALACIAAWRQDARNSWLALAAIFAG